MVGIARRKGTVAMLVLGSIAWSVRARADDAPLPAQTAPATGEPAPNTPPPTPLEPRKRNAGVTGHAHAGLGQRRLFDGSLLGADLTGGIGAYTGNVDVYGDIQVFFGWSEGLPVQQFRVGPAIDFEAFSRARLGAGFSLGGVRISRATGGSMGAFSFGARIFASVDVISTTERGALYLLGQLSVESAGPLFGEKSRGNVPTTVLWGPTIAVGVRF